MIRQAVRPHNELNERVAVRRDSSPRQCSQSAEEKRFGVARSWSTTRARCYDR